MKRILFALFLFGFGIHVIAQKPRSIRSAAVGTKFKPPKLIVSLGSFKDTMAITVKDAEAAIGMPIKISDTKGVPYLLSSYQFLYRKIVTSEDEATGKAYNTTSVKSSLFKTTPLPDLWLNVIKEELRPGEEFIFFDVIAKDAQGRVMYAPNIVLKLK